MLLNTFVFSRSKAIILIIVAWLPSVLFAIPAWFFLWSPGLEYLNSTTWIAVPCVITTANKRLTSDVVHWCYDLRYDYVFADTSYHGERFGFASSVVGGGPGDLPTLPALGNSLCYVDPNHPSRAVLRREYETKSFYVSLALGAIVAILAIFAWLWTRLIRSGKVPYWSDENAPSFIKVRSIAMLGTTTLILVLVSNSPSAVASDLEFMSTKLELDPAIDATQVTATWQFRWIGDHEVKLRIVPSCDCVKAITDQATYRPGDSGIISAEFNTSFKTGIASYSYDVFTEDDNHPVHLMARIQFHPLFSAPTLAAKWTVGEAVESRTLPIAVLESTRLTHVEALDEPKCPFIATAKLNEKGDGFTVEITPRDRASLDKPGLTPIVIRTDHPVTTRRDITVYAWVLSASSTEPTRK
jgi:Protein of unknown function (DUF1573)/Protein of unknown function (DUF3592)